MPKWNSVCRECRHLKRVNNGFWTQHLLGNIVGCIMQQNSGHLMHTFGTRVGWEQMRHGALWKGVNAIPDTLYRSEGGPSGLNPCSSPAFCLLSIIIDMAPSLSAICGLFTSGCPLCSWRSFLYKEGLRARGRLAPLALRGAVPFRLRGPTHPLQTSSQGHNSPAAAALQQPGPGQGDVTGAQPA